MKKGKNPSPRVAKRRSPTGEEVERLVAYARRSLERAFAAHDASIVAEALVKRSMTTGEPIEPSTIEALRRMAGEASAATALIDSAPVLLKAKRRAAQERQNLVETRSRAAQRKREGARIIAARLMEKRPTPLRRLSKSQLAKHVAAELKRRGRQPPSNRTIRRWLTKLP